MSEHERPYRHLCPEADERDAMDDAEFWAHVLPQQPQWTDEDAGPDLDAALKVGECGVCGSTSACGYDSEGRALIHATTPEEQR